jgi:hypothetical protein
MSMREIDVGNRGRKRKPNVERDRRGKSRGVSSQDLMAEALAYRRRDLLRAGISPEHALDALAGFTLGRLLLRHRADSSDPGSINEAQFNAGEAWAKLVRRHAAIMGYTLSSPKSPSFVLAASGLSCMAGPTESEVSSVRRQFANCYGALMEACRLHGLRVRDITYAVCLDDRPLESLSREDYGQLRIGLNALAKIINPGNQTGWCAHYLRICP